MLDFSKLSEQMQGVSYHLAQESAIARQRLEQAHHLLRFAEAHQSDLVRLRQTWQQRMTFTAAEPMESLSHRQDILIAPPNHTIFATDGSQIAPSHHEIAYCYLINVGRVALHYGQNRHPILDSVPEVFYRSDDLYASRQWGIRTEEWLGYRRTVLEATVLAELGAELIQSAHESGTTSGPLLAMVDGSLIHWFLEPLPTDARDRILPLILEAWDQLRTHGIPLVGYLSAARSGEALNFLRLQACPHPTPDCMTHCDTLRDRAPCQLIDTLKDANFWSALLQPGQRSPLWRSSAKILEMYGDHAIYFCYVHVGTEVARLEFPAWVAEDETLLTTALSLTLAQVYKGYGYPVALAEAHNQAVVRGGDRTRFFALLEQQMIRAGLRNVSVSYKEARKRGSIA
jgi:hypothetical protein